VSNQYGKIFQQIYDGSLRSDPMVRLVFMDMVILADKDGVVDMTHEAIAARTNVPVKTVYEAIKSLEGPDTRSRSSKENGARIKRLDEHRDWGWYLINYEYYVKKSSAWDRVEQNRINKKRQRERDKSSDVSNGQRPSAMSAHIDIDVDIDKTLEGKNKKRKKKFEFPDWVDKDMWFEFKKYRKEINAPVTTTGEKLLLADLKKLVDSGENQTGVINQSIKSGKWKGLFAVKKSFNQENTGSYNPDADRKFEQYKKDIGL